MFSLCLDLTPEDPTTPLSEVFQFGEDTNRNL